ncbi:Uncharacterized protein APZ42_010433, partial [Daphnia magna]
DPSHVSRRRPVCSAAADIQKTPSPPRQRIPSPPRQRTPSPPLQRRPSPPCHRESPRAQSSPIVSLLMSPVLLILSQLRSPTATPPVAPPRLRRRIQPDNSSVEPEYPLHDSDVFEPSVSRRNRDSDGVRAQPPVEPIESTLEQSSFEEPKEPVYKIHIDGSNKEKNKLTNGLGYCCTKKRVSGKSFTWRCSTRRPQDPCKARITQKIRSGRNYLVEYSQEDFQEKLHNQDSGVHHNHPPDHGNHERIPIFKNAKKEALLEKFKPPKRIIFDELKKNKEMAGRDMPDVENATRRL